MKKITWLLLGLLAACNPRNNLQNNLIFTAVPTQVLSASASPVSNPIESQADGSKTLLLLNELQILAAQRQTDLVSQPGWLYFHSRIAGSHQTTFANWGVDLDEYEQERWMLLDMSGKITMAVYRILDSEQQPLQVSVLKNGNWRNLTLGAESPADMNDPFDPNFGFYELADRLVQQGRQLHSDTIYHDCWYQGERYTISDGENYYEAVFNPGRRSLRWIKTWQISAGSIILVDSLEIMVEKRISEPPLDILPLLNEFSMP